MERRIFEPEHDMFRESVRRFFQKEVEPHRDRWYEQGQIDREIYRKGGEQGLLLMQVPEEYGGAGIGDFRYEQILLEENLRYGDSGLYFTLHSRLVAPYIAGLGNDEQKRRFLPRCASGQSILGIALTEPGAGSDLAGIKTRAEDRGDHFLLNGAKTYISNGINGDVFVVAARTAPAGEGGRKLGLFLVERDMPGFARGRNLKKMGLNSQDTAELFFENVRVPKANVLGDPARGFYYLMEYLVEERLISAAQYVAASQVAFDLTLDFIRERRIFGQAVGDFQVNRFKMADMRTQIDIAQVFVDHCVTEFNAGRLGAADIARAKLFCSELEGRVTDECVQLHGGAGYMDEYRISRMYRDARVSRIYAGSSEVMREIIARSIGLDPRKPAPGS